MGAFVPNLRSLLVENDPMTKQPHLRLSPLLVVAALLGCATPNEDVAPPAEDGPPADDDVGGNPPPDDPPEDPNETVPLESGACVIQEEPPFEGIRHQCAGSLHVDLTGTALGQSIDETYFIDFGEGVEGDSYEQARVAACCGPYDGVSTASEEPGYSRSCLYDAVQQFCSAIPYYLWDAAAVAKENDDDLKADFLTKLGNDLSTASGQADCLTTLWSGGPAEGDYTVMYERSWNPAYNLWVTIDTLEAYDVYLPEDPGDWITCKSIFENDGTVMPDMSHDPVWQNLGLDAGSLELVESDLVISAVADGGELLLGRDGVGKPLVGALQVAGGQLRVDGVLVDQWRLATLREVVATEQRDGALVVAAGSLTFVGAVVMLGDTITVPVRNATDIVLRPTEGGWSVEPFKLVYTAANGDAWTLRTSMLEFSAG